MFKKSFVLFSIIPLLIAACAPAASQPEEMAVAPAVEVYREVVEEAAPMADQAFKGQSLAAETGGAAVERIVIKNGRLEIVVPAPQESMDRIAKLAEELGGYVVSANLYQNTLGDGREVPRATITIRVLAEKMDEAMARIEAESDQLPRNKTVDSQDVTSEYTDLESRLRNLEAAEAQLVEIMESATRTEDVLNVYNQLVQVREQIEVIKGQMKYYEESARLSSISVDLIANEAVQPINIGGWEPVGIVKDAIEALIRGLQVLVSVLIWLVVFVLPILLVIFVPLFLIVRGVIRWRRRRKGLAAGTSSADQDQANS